MNIHIIQHVSFEPAGMIADWIAMREYNVSYSLTFEKDINWPSVNDLDMLVIMGGPMSVDDEDKFEWLKTEKSFIKEVIASGKLVLGICLGSQLLAQALGAKVYPNKEKEIGFFPVTKTREGKQDEVFSNSPESWTVFKWHGDTFDLPDEAVHLFESTACKHQVFRKGNCTGIQFHPEADNALLRSMIDHGRNELVEAAYVQTEKEILDNDVTEENRSALYNFLTRLTQ